MKKLTLIIIFLSTIFWNNAMGNEAEARLMRFPTVFKQQVVFSYAGDLYTVSLDGGTARKITTHDGYEMFPKFSPDGSQIAFTAQYDGNTEVFVMPSQGGEPKRITYTATLSRDDISDRMGPNNIVMAWTPNGKNIIYRSRKTTFNDFVGQLYTVSAEGGMSEQLPLPAGGFCSFSPDGKKLAYNQIFRDFRTWKYYQGGMAADVWIYNFSSKKCEQITDNIAQDVQPMWYKNRIYFLSDRDRTMNLFVYDINTKSTEKVTEFEDYDIKFPSLGDDKIIFEKGGYLYTLDLESHEIVKLEITINDDLLGKRTKYVDASSQIQYGGLSPDGSHALFGARGDIFVLPSNEGITYNITSSSGAHDRNPSWSPDGKHIAYISDKSGEFEIYIQSTDFTKDAVAITSKADTYTFSFKWSPDSKKIVWSDKKMRLRYIDIESKTIGDVAQSGIWEYTDYNWSPDSKWIVFREPSETNLATIRLYSLESKSTTDLTMGWYNAQNPIFSADGKYLFFSSDREFTPIYSQTEWNHAYNNMAKIYLITLAKDTPSPFAPKITVLGEEKTGKENDSDKEESAQKTVKIDLENIQDRIINLPVSAGYYFNLNSAGDKLYYSYTTRESKPTLKVFDLKENKETDLKYHGWFTISADKKKMMVSQHKSYSIIPMPTAPIKTDKTLDLSGMTIWVDVKQEWEQIYNEAWRQMRDFFYVENMHGVNWKNIQKKYGQLLPWVNNRHDLNYLIGEMIGELNVGHAYINGGDIPKPKRIKTGLLGAQFTKEKNGFFKVTKVLKGENFRRNCRSPFTEIGVDVKENDYILAINGKSLQNVADIYSPLVGTAHKIIELTVNSKPTLEGSRKVFVKPIDSEADLYYYTWVQNNIDKVDKATNGQVGYIHIPDMGPEGLNEFVKYFYPQLNKKALIIDDRGNGGGNVSPMIIERLRRQITRANMSRNKQKPSTIPAQMMVGPKVLLINEYSASDGDLFPYSFKKHKLGTVIGMRSWGGVVGIRGSLPFIDGCDLRKPEFASYSSEESKWIIEGYGVDPDIEVRNDPAKEFAGEDQQLNKAIEVILKDLKEFNYKVPPIPKAPDKSK